MKVEVKNDFFELFPEAQIGIIFVEGITNNYGDKLSQYENLINTALEKSKIHITNPEFSANPVIASWRDAFRKFKTKKGARCSIEALLKRVSTGKGLGTINPLVDIYNGISLEYGIPCGAEDIDKVDDTMYLTKAKGNESFITLGSEKSEPPYENEIIYKDNTGGICRCFNWREAMRTMITEDTKNAVLVMEMVDLEFAEQFAAAMNNLEKQIANLLGGKITSTVLSIENPKVSL